MLSPKIDDVVVLLLKTFMISDGVDFRSIDSVNKCAYRFAELCIDDRRQGLTRSNLLQCACTFGIEKWSCQELTPTVPDDRAIEWIFVTDLLNFSFWTESSDRQYQVVFNQKVHTGYWALCAAVNRAVEEGFDLLDPNTYQHVTEAQLKRIFRSVGNVEIPLFTERLRLLRESGKTLVRDFGGSFKNVVRMCEGVPQVLFYYDAVSYSDQLLDVLRKGGSIIATFIIIIIDSMTSVFNTDASLPQLSVTRPAVCSKDDISGTSNNQGYLIKPMRPSGTLPNMSTEAYGRKKKDSVLIWQPVEDTLQSQDLSQNNENSKLPGVTKSNGGTSGGKTRSLKRSMENIHLPPIDQTENTVDFNSSIKRLGENLNNAIDIRPIGGGLVPYITHMSITRQTHPTQYRPKWREPTNQDQREDISDPTTPPLSLAEPSDGNVNFHSEDNKGSRSVDDETEEWF
ncbi:hypothetical protein CLF_108859 [Clonorchis sinensis]|uniref:Queuosine 5'-phosphate N-glycosylase/hydrolase n=1 Tax=Clonorchis sinensis TaxID=79923 RepID=G7YIN0_CLOSI|nr:hypothetical protein CLF_108859 [Clonorchis sinensis]